MRRLCYVVPLLILAACGGTEQNPPPAASLTLVPVDSGYDFSVYVASPPGDESRLMVVERGGKIWLRKNGVRQAAPFLDLSSLTGGGHEYGVYSIAFHPDYATNRRLFVYYVDNDGNSQLSEFAANPDFDTADPASEKSILHQVQPSTAVLYGGQVAFGPDGMLYFAFGDSDNGGEPLSFAQDSGSWIGKMLRLDVDAGSPYAVPPDNPYVNRPGWKKEIWQLGFRNPWRWSFDRSKGDLYVGDVGEESTEEINFLAAPIEGGNNFGWPFMEGDGCYQPAVGCETAGLVTPVVEYTHINACAVTGGYVYRGRRFPAMRGTYLYSDFCGGWIRSFRMTSSGPADAYPEVAPPLVNGLTDNAVSFGEDADGEVYVVYASGRIYRVEEEE
ncbi:MAG TPA: PQQ-dependent sugar dehydrogenase [Gemmatimonadales bacterium]|nr:PQQ-dependent sugar dehydrogenase [Gemmatimonadales bacterium]